MCSVRKVYINLPYEKYFYQGRPHGTKRQMYHVLSVRQFLSCASDYLTGKKGLRTMLSGKVLVMRIVRQQLFGQKGSKE